MFSHGFNPVDVFFQIIVLLFAICVHESAHAWMANHLGDPTAKMLGRISLNPIVHIDLFGTIIMPLILIVLGYPPFGWAKPTPVDTRNFKNLVRDDILTAVAGPASNFLTAFVSVIALAIIWHGSNAGIGANFHHADLASPLATLFYLAMWINVVLAVFNLIPLPPLDGSHVIRHFLSYNALRVYDRIGYGGLIVIMFILPMLGISIIGAMIAPFMAFFERSTAVTAASSAWVREMKALAARRSRSSLVRRPCVNATLSTSITCSRSASDARRRPRAAVIGSTGPEVTGASQGAQRRQSVTRLLPASHRQPSPHPDPAGSMFHRVGDDRLDVPSCRAMSPAGNPAIMDGWPAGVMRTLASQRLHMAGPPGRAGRANQV